MGHGLDIKDEVIAAYDDISLDNDSKFVIVTKTNRIYFGSITNNSVVLRNETLNGSVISCENKYIIVGEAPSTDLQGSIITENREPHDVR